MKKIIFLILSCIAIQNLVHAMERPKRVLNPSDLLIKDIENNNRDGVEEFLLTHKIDLNKPNKDGRIPLHVAIEEDNAYIAELLLKNGANPNLKDGSPKGRTPLHLAASNGSENLVRLLLAYGANVNTQDNFGNTPLYNTVVFSKPVIAKILLQNWANAFIPNNKNETAHSAALALKNQEIEQLIERQEKIMAILRGFKQEESPLNLLPSDKEILKDILSKI